MYVKFFDPWSQWTWYATEFDGKNEFFGIVVKQGNKALLDKLNAGLAGVKADGSYAQIYRKWFQAEAPALPAN